MDPSTLVIVVVFGVMFANQFVMRFRRQIPSPAVFWTLQAADVIVGVGVLAFGLPGMARYPLLSWVVGLLLFSHVLQNLSLRSRWIEAARRRARMADEDALLEEARLHDPPESDPKG